MKTQNNKLVFSKSSILELQSSDLLNINGGSTIVGGDTCTGCMCGATQTILTAGNKSIVMPTQIEVAM
ncbi:hypothetical protein N7U66_12735 [Lacinutrix neustonica]|uniref:Uncharacterized protein n=1 Tax=Lacinutrix neustonica TaxID=2980107 RepID=A0A9E8SCI3_9FLAO|nr:hypothetical protein [Lacinutrix neustonica]WAC01041.1 hypothetical protein N7U66_12735 [Lacinutrix neustonica]